MMNIFSKYKKLIITAVVALAGFWVYSTFIAAPDDALVSSTPSAATSQAGRTGREVVNLLNDLENIKLNESFFASNVFQSLEDFSTPIAPQPKGRTNPFAPIGQDAGGFSSLESGGTGEEETGEETQ